MTQLSAALLGRELTHSISHALHRELVALIAPKYAISEASLHYKLVECSDLSTFTSWIAAAPSRGYIGANVTYPYKNDLFGLSALHVGVASRIESANVVRFLGALTECASTDGAGFMNALLRKFPHFDLEPYHLVILGDGAAAKAVTYALCTKWMPLSLTIVSRTPSRARALVEFALADSAGPSVRVMSINDAMNKFPESAHRLVIQATPVGQKNQQGNLLAGFAWSDMDMLIDLVYNPIRTPILINAANAGAKTMNGLGMLIEQAALSQVFWYSGMIPAESPLSPEEYSAIKLKMNHLLSS